MSSHVVVVDKTARRHTIKVGPETLLNSILVQACRKAGIEDSSNYGLKHSNKTLDLSLPYRFAKLAPGAKLELIQLPKGREDSNQVTVALQMMDGTGERLTHKFPSSSSIWSVLRTFEVNATSRGVKGFSITETCSTPAESAGSGRLFYRMPVVQILNNELGTFEELQQTLGSMGFSSGTALLRLKHKVTEIPLEEAVERISIFADAHQPLETYSIPNNSQTIPSQSSILTSRSGSINADIVEAPTLLIPSIPRGPAGQLEPPAIETTDSTPQADKQWQTVVPAGGNSIPSGPTSIKVFKPPERSTPYAATIDLSDGDYEPNIAQLQKIQTHLQDAARPQKLLSDEELREKDRLAKEKKEKIPEVEVKVRFPDQSMIQATFRPTNTAEDLYTFVRSCLRYPTEPFYLFQAPPVRRLAPTQGRLVLDCHFTHRTLINFSWEAKNVSDKARAKPPLHDKHIASARAIEALKPIDRFEEEEDATAAMKAVKAGARGSGGSASPGSSSGGVGNKIPKWLKLPRKK